MGCSFFYSGKLSDIKVQEKIVEFYRSCFSEADLIIQPDPRIKLRALIDQQGREKAQVKNDYPFNFFGVIPYCKEVVLEHGQFIFDRNRDGLLVRFYKVPDSHHVPPQYPSPDELDVDIHIIDGGYNRLVSEEWGSFALLLNIIRLRWWPELRVNDSYYVCRDVGQMIKEYGLSEKLKNDALDFKKCLKLFDEEYNKRRQPESFGPSNQI